MAIHFHEEDLPSADLFAADAPIAVDTEAHGPIIGPRPALPGAVERRAGDEHLVRFGPDSDYAAPNLKALLADPDRLKLYHFARFDVAAIMPRLSRDMARRSIARGPRRGRSAPTPTAMA